MSVVVAGWRKGRTMGVVRSDGDNEGKEGQFVCLCCLQPVLPRFCSHALIVLFHRCGRSFFR